jgi:hypothetical protein
MLVSPQAFVILSFGISLNGRDPPKVARVLLNTTIQLFAECAQSLGCNLFWVVVEHQPAMSVPLLRMRGFSVLITVITTAVWCDGVQVVLNQVLGRHPDSNADWVFLTEAFKEAFQELNGTSALCAAFPEAVGFASARC